MAAQAQAQAKAKVNKTHKEDDILFPNFVPFLCYPNVSSMAQLLKELNTNIKKPQSSYPSELMQTLVQDMNTIRESSDIHYINNRCHKFRIRLNTIESTITSSSTNQQRNELIANTALHRYCIARCGCPPHMDRLLVCWMDLHKQYQSVGGIKYLMEHGVSPNMICRQERESVERCIGGKVGGLVKAIEETSDWN